MLDIIIMYMYIYVTLRCVCVCVCVGFWSRELQGAVSGDRAGPGHEREPVRRSLTQWVYSAWNTDSWTVIIMISYFLFCIICQHRDMVVCDIMLLTLVHGVFTSPS